jgi:type II secretory pathway pseudopilin PulG
MKTFIPNPRWRSALGFSLLELSLVIALILSLCGAIGFGVAAIQKWKKGKDGSLALQAVYAAQRSYMADHPTADVAAVTSSQLQAYLPQGWTTMPVVTGLEGEALTVDFTVMPPKLLLGTSPYDPSGRTDDGLWDTGD